MSVRLARIIEALKGSLLVQSRSLEQQFQRQRVGPRAQHDGCCDRFG